MNLRLIELFSGYGSQALALKYLGIPFDHHFVCDFDKYAIQVYNALHGTSFKTTDVKEIKGSDLNIVGTDIFTYLLTYSFPCTDLSLAGKGAGMSKGSGTRSGLLWEVERILTECKKIGNLPQYLMMENVPQVIGQKNIKDFAEWIAFLDGLGYKSYYQQLNAKNYEIPQNRERVFMVSMLDKSKIFQFLEPKPLKLRLKDLLEKEMDEKYFISEKMLKGMQTTKFESYKLENKLLDKNDVASTIIARFEGTPQLVSVDDNFVKVVGEETPNSQAGKVYDSKGLSPTLTAGTHGYAMGYIQTNETICLNSKVDGKQPSLQDRIYDSEGIATAITTSFAPSILIPESTKKGYVEAFEGDGVYIDRPGQKRGVVQREMTPTIKCSGDDIGVVTNNLRIRKLTPRECWRLMGVKDEDFDKVRFLSDTQLYKLAGNSIVVNVLMGIFEQMFIKNEIKDYQMSMFDFIENAKLLEPNQKEQIVKFVEFMAIGGKE